MRVTRFSWLIAGVAAFVATAGVSGPGAAAAGAEADAPTFTENVASILYENCVACHRTGEVAPMSLITYQETRPWGRSIKNKVMSGEMPPWHADPAVGRFLNERRLTDAERDTVVQWVDAGAPEGDRAKLPPAPTFADGWQIGTPDLIVEMPEAFEVPAEGEVAYQYFSAPTNFTEDKWVQAVEVRAGAPSAVHHILAYARAPGTERRPPAFNLIPVGERAGAAVRAREARARERGRPARPEGRGPGTLIGTMAPGTNPIVFEPNSAMRVPKGTQVVFQVHYTATGEPMSDRSSIGMVFSDEPPEQEVRFGQFLNPYFEIPAGEANHRVDALVEFTEDTEIYALFPHTHLRGKRWEYELVHPDGRREPVLSVPGYDFNWQIYYQFEEPLTAPKGTRLEASAWYDNSAANKANPDPASPVRWGEQTWEEMHYTGISYSVKSEK
ncbi:MAG: thiol-disulfide isomerase [Acidobacteria bacterium]|nr:thiol-disulfide isomerase [Acidobacteriota bacterium]